MRWRATWLFLAACGGEPVATQTTPARIPTAVPTVRAQPLDAGGTPVPGPRRPEVLISATAIAASHRDLQKLVGQRLCDHVRRPVPCWGDEEGNLYSQDLGDPISPELTLEEAQPNVTWRLHGAGAPFEMGLRGAISSPPWVERRGARIVHPGAFPSTDVILVVEERTVTVFFLLADDKAPTRFSLHVPEGAKLSARTDTPVLASNHEARAPQIGKQGDAVTLSFDPKGMKYPLLAGVQLELQVPNPAYTSQLRWRRIAADHPGKRSDAAMAYDEARGRVVLFGGQTDERVWEYDGATWSATRSVGSPWLRGQLPGAYDANRRKTVFFGGADFHGAHGNDTWEWDGKGLTRALPDASPPGRYWAAMAYDKDRKRAVLFGGTGSEGHSDSCHYECEHTWEWDGAAWAKHAATGPSPRIGHAMAYDVRNKRITLFGGMSYRPECRDPGCSDTWQWDGHTWTKSLPKVSPPPRSFHAMAYDESRKRVVLFGGRGPACRKSPMKPECGDTWEWDGAAWAEIKPPRSPEPRGSHALVYDERRKRVVLYGGVADDTEHWEWDGATWTPFFRPPSSHGAAMAYDASERRMVVFGGESYDSDEDHLPAGTWLGDGIRWEKRGRAASPEPRRYHAMAADSSRRQIVLFGGESESRARGDTWVWSPSAWKRLSPSPSPNARYGHAMAYDESRKVVVLYGGNQGSSIAADTWEWSGSAWSRKMAQSAPGPREWHRMVYDSDRKRIVLYGGSVTGSAACNGPCADLWAWDGATWAPLSAIDATPARAFAALAYDPSQKKIFLFGGRSRQCLHGECDDLWQWDGARWSLVVLPKGPSARSGAAMEWSPDRGELFLYGGTEARGEAWALH